MGNIAFIYFIFFRQAEVAGESVSASTGRDLYF